MPVPRQGRRSETQQCEAAAAEVEMFADAVACALAARHPRGELKASEAVLRAFMRAGGASALLAGVDAVREVAARGEARPAALDAFVRTLTRNADDPSSNPALLQ
jgi:hypothetical protein